jgi:hypothetical protein
MTQHTITSRAFRAKAARNGIYERHDGTAVGVRSLADVHLVNALLRALADDEPEPVRRMLTAEVRRRRLVSYATSMARERQDAMTSRSEKKETAQ